MTHKAIVIGTGAGGLMAAASLARRGFEVTALERAKQLGGYLNPFARRHFLFDPGVHYVGQCRKGELMWGVLRSVGVDAEQIFCGMDPDGYDVLRFPGFEMRMCAGLERYRDRLARAFPGDVADIDAFFATLRAIRDITEKRPEHRGLGALARARGVPRFLYWSRKTFGELLEHHFRNPRLRSILGAQCGDYGLPPSKAPAILGTGVLLHFMEGAYFPRGGSGSLRDALVDSARRRGAVFRRRAEVQTIRTHRGRVVGVTLANGDELEADVVVSAIDPVLTYDRLLADTPLPTSLRRKVRRTVPSAASICVFLGMKRDLRQHGLGANNVWDYPTWDLDEAFEAATRGVVPDEWAFFLSPNSLKDDTRSMAPEGCSTLEVVTLAPFAPFAKWAHLKSFKRGPEYEAKKRELADSVMASVNERWPGLVGDVVVEDVASPVTNIHYAGSPAGSIYGPAATPDQFGLNAYRPWSPIAGLYLAGSGVLGPGVATCLASGAVAAKLASKRSLRAAVAAALPRPRATAALPAGGGGSLYSATPRSASAAPASGSSPR